MLPCSKVSVQGLHPWVLSLEVEQQQDHSSGSAINFGNSLCFPVYSLSWSLLSMAKLWAAGSSLFLVLVCSC